MSEITKMGSASRSFRVQQDYFGTNSNIVDYEVIVPQVKIVRYEILPKGLVLLEITGKGYFSPESISIESIEKLIEEKYPKQKVEPIKFTTISKILNAHLTRREIMFPVFLSGEQMRMVNAVKKKLRSLFVYVVGINARDVKDTQLIQISGGDAFFLDGKRVLSDPDSFFRNYIFVFLK